MCTAGSGTSSKLQFGASHATSPLPPGFITDSRTSLDSLQASDALIMAAFTESTAYGSDSDVQGLYAKRPVSPSAQSQAGSEADSVTSSKLSSRPIAGWKGRMSSMLIRSSPGQPKPEKEAVRDTLKGTSKKVSCSSPLYTWQCRHCVLSYTLLNPKINLDPGIVGSICTSSSVAQPIPEEAL